MHEEDKVYDFVRGLKQDLRFELRRQRPSTLVEAINLAEDTYDALCTDRPPRHSAQDGAGFQMLPKTGSTAMEIDRLEFRGRDRDTRPSRATKCFNCQGFGHIARYCPSPRRTSGRDRPPAPRANQPRINTLEAESGNGERQ